MLLLFLPAAGRARAAQIIIDNADLVGQGLNDPTPVLPIGGNNATTLGDARLAALNQAAAIWSAQLVSLVPIHVRVTVVPLTCSENSAVLASTSVGTVHRDFPSAPLPATWYPQALANALAGTDLAPTEPDISTVFNSQLGNVSCLTGGGFYLGLDGKPANGQIDLVTIALHEFAHGLGFQTFADFSTGAKLSGADDAFLVNLAQQGAAPSSVSAMTDAQRVAAAVSDPNLYWSGASVQAAAPALTAGLIAGHVRLHAPTPFDPSTSVVHYSTALVPLQLMQPYYNGALRDLTLTKNLLRDIGWTVVTPAVPAVPFGPLVLLAVALAAVAALTRARRR
jgi:hypothetical protein